MRSHRVTVLPGDASGPEIMAQAVRVLRVAAERFGFEVEVEEGLIGAAALAATGRALPRETLALCREGAAVLVGPLAGARHVDAPPSQAPRQALVTLRDWLGTFATVRPVRSFLGLAGVAPLDPRVHPIDLLVVHDHTSGLFYGRPRGTITVGGEETATNTMVYTSTEVARVADLACKAALRRRRAVVSVDEAKLLDVGRLWARTVDRVGAAYPAVSVRRRDAAHFFYELVNGPEAYDVVVTEMSMGHLIGAVSTGLTGAFALHPEGYVGGQVDVFQPAHGSAPHLAGSGLADPLGAIRAGALMLDWALGEHAAAEAIEAAVAAVLLAGTWPHELCSRAMAGRPSGSGPRPTGTTGVAEAVIAQLQRAPAAPPVVTGAPDGGSEPAMLGGLSPEVEPPRA